jgi:hypothetical protein
LELRDAEGAMGDERRIHGQRHTGRPVPEVQTGALEVARDHGERLNPGAQELVLSQPQLSNLTPAEWTIDPSEEGQE